MYQEYKKCLYISGVDTLRDLIEDLISKQEKCQTLLAFFVPTTTNGDLDDVLSHILYLMNLSRPEYA